MKWTNLKIMRCPACGRPVQQEILKGMVECKSCNFGVGIDKFEEIVQGMYRPKMRMPEAQDNQEALNSL